MYVCVCVCMCPAVLLVFATVYPPSIESFAALKHTAYCFLKKSLSPLHFYIDTFILPSFQQDATFMIPNAVSAVSPVRDGGREKVLPSSKQSDLYKDMVRTMQPLNHKVVLTVNI